jgi:hypothetical protein
MNVEKLRSSLRWRLKTLVAWREGCGSSHPWLAPTRRFPKLQLISTAFECAVAQPVLVEQQLHEAPQSQLETS